MLHHVSIAVENPARVANVLSQVMAAQAFEFPIHPNSYIVVVGDQYGTAIEVLPANTAWVAGEIEAEIVSAPLASPFTPTHVAISVPVSLSTIKAIGTREGWLVRQCDRGPFGVIELWLENRVMVELLPQELATQYLNFMTPDNFAAFAKQAQASAVS
ncbi:MAG TPA: hypothetical protein V6D29_20155 [Leptolyngbyaceae cyanobacterium]